MDFKPVFPNKNLFCQQSNKTYFSNINDKRTYFSELIEQNDGKLSKRAVEKEFSVLTEEEVNEIERNYELRMKEF
ncbi:hypothetical protein AB9T88_00685 [Flavobacterium sp. LBUM151]